MQGASVSCQKLGQPVPLSYLCSEKNTSKSQPHSVDTGFLIVVHVGQEENIPAG